MTTLPSVFTRLVRLSIATLPVVLAVGCADLQRSTTGQTVQGWTIAADPSVILMPTPDAVERGEGVVGGSGASVSAALRDGLLAHRIKIAPTEKTSVQEAFGEAAAAGYRYVLKSSITEWEDNATEWSSNPDKATLTLELYAADTKQLVATGTHRVVGRTVEMLPKPTRRFIPELADHALAKVFGWVPRSYYAD